MSEAVDIVLAPIGWISWVIALPIRAITWTISTIRARNYDPEQLVCPACGFRGDSGTGGKSCMIKFIRTTGQDKASIQHMCFRCGCDEIFTSLFLPGQKWLPSFNADQAAKIKEASAREAL